MNQEIKSLMRKEGVYQWQIAIALGIGEATLTRWLRVKLTEEKESMIMEAIQKVRAADGQ